MSTQFKGLASEYLGSLWFVLLGSGFVVIAHAFPEFGFGVQSKSFAFGLGLLTAGWLFGRSSKALFNPAVSIALWLNREISGRDFVTYLAAQVAGAITAAVIVASLDFASPTLPTALDNVSNGYGLHSPDHHSMSAGFTIEALLSFLFVTIVMSLRDLGLRARTIALASSVVLVAMYVVAEPFTNGAINPARATAPAILSGGWALSQLWMFWAAPLLGAVTAGLMHRRLGDLLPLQA